jgi:hypothetical protein
MPERRSSSSTSWRQLGLPGEQPLAVEAPEQALAIGRQASQREVGVDVGHLEL